MKKFLNSLLKDEQGNISSKRFLGIIGALSMIGSMVYYNTENLVSNVLIIVLGCLGLTSIDKYTNKDTNTKKDE